MGAIFIIKFIKCFESSMLTLDIEKHRNTVYNDTILELFVPPQ